MGNMKELKTASALKNHFDAVFKAVKVNRLK